MTLVTGGKSVSLPTGTIGQPTAVIVNADWAELARGALDGGAHAVVRRGDMALSQLALPITASALLEILSRPIGIERWVGTSDTTRPLAVEVNASTDSTARRALRRIATKLTIPPALGGLALDAEVAEFGPLSTVSANGVVLTPDSLGRATLCAPCRAGASLAIAIVPRDRWWDVPRIRAHDIGWTELRDGAEWARYFTGD